MNQYSSNHQASHTLWYTPTPQKPFPFVYHNHLNHINTNYDDVDSDNSTTNGNNNNMVERSETASSSTITTLDKEHMFEKALTPSDVGKLNRLVIPKQHAEKYLPLASSANAANTSADGGAGGGGLLLGFEDETGKCWRFRYSYWNSSQSYVLTKGWSRYVKEKKLDAGDVVLFERHRFEPDRFFIGWRRRGSNPPVQQTVGWTGRSPSSSSYNFNINNNPNYNHEGYNSQTYYNNNHQQNGVQSQQCYAPSHQVSAFTNFLPQGKVEARQKSKKPGNSKRVRLFGVNLECEVEEEDENIIEDEPQTSDGSSLSSQGQGQVFSLGSGSRMGPTPYNYIDYVGYPPNNHDHMDMNFSQDFNQHMRNGLG